MAVASFSEYTPPGVVADARARIVDLTSTLWAGRTDGELVATVEEVQTLRSVIAAVEAGVVVEVDARQVAKTTLHYGSTADWLTHLGGLRKGEGRRVVGRAHALTSTMAATLQALADGVISPEQATVIVATIDALPSDLSLRAHGETLLLDHARGLDATDLAKAGRHLAQVVDPEGEDRRLEGQLERDERAAHTNRHFTIRADGAGGVWVKGRGSIEDGALLKSALLPLTCPEPTIDSETGEPVPDPRDGGARMWDALIALAQHGLSTDLPPTTHGAKPRLAITMSLADLATGLGHGVTDDGLEVPAGVARRLACDADLIPIVLGTHSEILDVGRTHRLVTPAIWQALIVRDAHCSFPACTRPPLMCHAHHIQHWLRGGKTNLDNLALLCRHHHRVIHNTPWEIRLNPHDKKPEFKPPPKTGQNSEYLRQRPRRECR